MLTCVACLLSSPCQCWCFACQTRASKLVWHSALKWREGGQNKMEISNLPNTSGDGCEKTMWNEISSVRKQHITADKRLEPPNFKSKVIRIHQLKNCHNTRTFLWLTTSDVTLHIREYGIGSWGTQKTLLTRFNKIINRWSKAAFYPTPKISLSFFF